jgi:hypothetical protein
VHLPKIAPKVMRTHAAPKSPIIRLGISMEIFINSPSTIAICQKAVTKIEIYKHHAPIIKLYPTEVHEWDFKKTIRYPKPMKIITCTS